MFRCGYFLPDFPNHQFFPQLVETTTLPGDQRVISVLNQNKQTPCQLPILVGAIIQAMGQTMAMAMASSSPASNCYLARVKQTLFAVTSYLIADMAV